jgi:tRNA/rRNA methyltransferase
MNNHPTIILVSPQLGENIGAAARCMLNFGLTDLRIITPRDGWPNPKAVDMAKGAGEVIKNAKIFQSLADANSDITKLYATTARTRDMEKPVYTANEVAEAIIKNSGKSAIMFGAERSGLSNEDITLADGICVIPVAPIYTSLNLAQAVNIICYEWFINTNYKQNEQSRHTEFISASSSTSKEIPKQVQDDEINPQLATKEDIAKMFEHLESELDKTDFFKVADKRPKMVVNIRNIFSRNNLTQQEVRTLRGIIKSLTK